MGRKSFLFIGVLFGLSLKVCGQDLAPQLWTNFSVGGIFKKNLAGNIEASYNTILDQNFKWHEVAVTPAVDFRFHKHFSLNGAFTYSWVKQSVVLSSNEFRPTLGLRVNFFEGRRYNLINFTRFQYRFFNYSDGSEDQTWRVRNLTTFIYSINRSSLLERSNWIALAGIEFFINAEDVRERFFNLFKARVGVTHRFPKNMNLGLNILYQEAEDNVSDGTPSILPVQPPDTRFVFELNFVYLLPIKEN